MDGYRIGHGKGTGRYTFADAANTKVQLLVEDTGIEQPLCCQEIGVECFRIDDNDNEVEDHVNELFTDYENEFVGAMPETDSPWCCADCLTWNWACRSSCRTCGQVKCFHDDGISDYEEEFFPSKFEPLADIPNGVVAISNEHDHIKAHEELFPENQLSNGRVAVTSVPGIIATELESSTVEPGAVDAAALDSEVGLCNVDCFCNATGPAEKCLRDSGIDKHKLTIEEGIHEGQATAGDTVEPFAVDPVLKDLETEQKLANASCDTEYFAHLFMYGGTLVADDDDDDFEEEFFSKCVQMGTEMGSGECDMRIAELGGSTFEMKALVGDTHRSNEFFGNHVGDVPTATASVQGLDKQGSGKRNARAFGMDGRTFDVPAQRHLQSSLRCC